MQIYFVIFATVLITPKLHGLQNKTVVKKTIRSQYEKYLKGHVFKKTTGAVDPQHCLSDCWAENDRCQSFNYLVDLDECELNEASEITAPGDLIDKSNVVYLTNPRFGNKQAPQMRRHTKQYTPPDPCASNPCTHADKCVKDVELGYICQHCDYGYHGPKCEEHVDSCNSNPCRYGGTCKSSLTSFQCICPFPREGKYCETVHRSYQFDLDGTGIYPYQRASSNRYRYFTANFWFKTSEKNVSYFMQYKPDDSSSVRFSVWRVGNAFFVELWEGFIYKFMFPLSYPVNDNNWHVATIVLGENAYLSFYLDGTRREAPQLTKGTPGASNLYDFRYGTLRIGYFKDSNGREYFFNGSISHVDIREYEHDYYYIRDRFQQACVPGTTGAWAYVVWENMHLSRKINCSLRNPIMGIAPHDFMGTSKLRWFEHEVSPPRDLSNFTMIFQMSSSSFPVDNPIQIACYGDSGDACHLSVVIHINMTLEIIIESTRFNVDLLPIFDYYQHIVVMTWTNQGGVFELVIDGVLQSRLVGIEDNGKITGQNRFMVGGSDIENRNYHGYLHNFNVWDKVLSQDMLYYMTMEPGDDMGNVVAWRDFKKPSSIPQEEFTIEKKTTSNFRYSRIGINNNFMSFPSTPASYAQVFSRSNRRETKLTFTIWFKLNTLPATLLTLNRRLLERLDMQLMVNNGTGTIQFAIDNSNVSLGEIAATATGWQFLAVTWASTGDLQRNLNGVHEQISSNFEPGFRLDFVVGSFWKIGGKENSFYGKVGQVNIWYIVLPPSALMAMSRGMNCIVSYGGISWLNFFTYRIGKIVVESGTSVYLPDFVMQNKRDEHCNQHFHACGKYRARLGWRSGDGRLLACFCENALSKDMNFNYGNGNYSSLLHSHLKEIK